jgi:hypothetical protein
MNYPTYLTLFEKIVHSLKKIIADEDRISRAKQIAQGLAIAIYEDKETLDKELQKSFSLVYQNISDISLSKFIHDEILYRLSTYTYIEPNEEQPLRGKNQNHYFYQDNTEIISHIKAAKDTELATYMKLILEIDNVNDKELPLYKFLEEALKGGN